MSQKCHVCESCTKICEEAKLTVKKLQKKVYILTIVCSVALTILGEQGTQKVIATIEGMNAAVSAVEGKPSKDIIDVNKHETVSIDDSIPKKWPRLYPDGKFEDPIKKKQNAGLQIKDSKINTIESTKLVQAKLPEFIIPNFLDNNKPPTVLDPIKTNPFGIPDPYTIFLTPSTIPFDIYCNTIGLGNNYGFGENYGYGSLNHPVCTPAPTSSTLLFIGAAAVLSKRTPR